MSVEHAIAIQEHYVELEQRIQEILEILEYIATEAAKTRTSTCIERQGLAARKNEDTINLTRLAKEIALRILEIGGNDAPERQRFKKTNITSWINTITRVLQRHEATALRRGGNQRKSILFHATGADGENHEDVYADVMEIDLFQAVINLMKNAWEAHLKHLAKGESAGNPIVLVSAAIIQKKSNTFTNQKGEEVKFSDRNAALVEFLPDQEYLAIRVTDNGPGEDIEQIETGLYSENEFTTKQEKGGFHGYGLPNVAASIKQHGGILLVDERQKKEGFPNNGLCFTILIPKEQKRQNPVPKASLAPQEKIRAACSLVHDLVNTVAINKGEITDQHILVDTLIFGTITEIQNILRGKESSQESTIDINRLLKVIIRLFRNKELKVRFQTQEKPGERPTIAKINALETYRTLFKIFEIIHKDPDAVVSVSSFTLPPNTVKIRITTANSTIQAEDKQEIETIAKANSISLSIETIQTGTSQKGTSITLQFPLAKETDPKVEAPEILTRGKVVVIDDDPTVIEGLLTRLQRINHDTRGIYDEAAFNEMLPEITESDTPTIIFLDQALGGWEKQGNDIARQIRLSGPQSTILIIDISANGSPERGEIQGLLFDGAAPKTTLPGSNENIYRTVQLALQSYTKKITSPPN